MEVFCKNMLFFSQTKNMAYQNSSNEESEIDEFIHLYYFLALSYNTIPFVCLISLFTCFKLSY